MAQRPHVPKFGNWDGDNVPYTAYFESARKEKSDGVRINPNDPEQNPGAFSNIRGPENYVRRTNVYDQQKSGARGSSHKTMANSEYSSSERSPSDHSTSSAVKTNHHRNRNTSDDLSYKSVSIPKFGEWDEKDPRSAEGFTVIFNKVKEEKHIAASKFPHVPIQNAKANANDNYRTSPKNENRKKFCCLF